MKSIKSVVPWGTTLRSSWLSWTTPSRLTLDFLRNLRKIRNFVELVTIPKPGTQIPPTCTCMVLPILVTHNISQFTTNQCLRRRNYSIIHSSIRTLALLEATKATTPRIGEPTIKTGPLKIIYSPLLEFLDFDLLGIYHEYRNS